jgi:hypothetical protein
MRFETYELSSNGSYVPRSWLGFPTLKILSSSDTCTLVVSIFTDSETIANNVKIEDISANPYVVQVTQDAQIIIVTSGVQIPDFPSTLQIATMIIGFLGAVLHHPEKTIASTLQTAPNRLIFDSFNCTD